MHEKLKGFPKCYAVNLEESVDRRNYMNAEFQRLGLDGICLQYKRLEDSNLVVKGDPHLLKTLPLGATTSHLLSIKWWYENTNEEMAAFFEDDCDFTIIEKWNFNFNDYIKKFGVLWDGLQLCVMHEGWAVMYPRVRNGFDHGLQCYIIKRHYAKKIIDYYFEDDNTINFRKMPYDRQTNEVKRLKPTIENAVYGLGIFYIHPIFNHNIKFETTVHDPGAKVLQHVAERSYEYVNQWWDKMGSPATLDQLFDYEYCCPPPQVFNNVYPVDN